jgi:hypothetical protein
MQAGSTGPANFIVSTIVEAENLLPYLMECQRERREASVCIPLPFSFLDSICPSILFSVLQSNQHPSRSFTACPSLNLGYYAS